MAAGISVHSAPAHDVRSSSFGFRIASRGDRAGLCQRAIEHFLNSVSDAFALIDQDGRVIRANIAYRRLTGPAGGAHDASIINFLDVERREACREALRTLDEKAPVRSLQLRFRIGNELKLIDAELSWLGPHGLISFVGRDVTRQDTLERERMETATARDAVEQVGDIGHWRAGRDFKLQCSPGASRILGLDPAAPPLVLTDFVEMIAPEDRNAAIAAAREAFDKRRPLKHTFRLRRPDGTTRVIRVAGAPSIDARGQIEAMHGVVVDKTEGHAALQAAMNSDSTVRRFVQGRADADLHVRQGHARPDGQRQLDRGARRAGGGAARPVDVRHAAVAAGKMARGAPPGAARRSHAARPRPVRQAGRPQAAG